DAKKYADRLKEIATEGQEKQAISAIKLIKEISEAETRIELQDEKNLENMPTDELRKLVSVAFSKLIESGQLDYEQAGFDFESDAEEIRELTEGD
ncbi:MAG: hypothetical protein UT54_C0037G0001, partial [Candidatus Daviesbacteria bacterium GW2011_GWB1_39_5]